MVACTCSESAVHGFGSVQNLVRVRKEARKQGLDPPPQVLGPKVKKPKAFEWSPMRKAWLVPFPGAGSLCPFTHIDRQLHAYDRHISLSRTFGGLDQQPATAFAAPTSKL